MLNKVLALAGGDGLKRVNLSGHLVGHLSLVQRLYDVLVLFCVRWMNAMFRGRNVHLHLIESCVAPEMDSCCFPADS